MFVRRLLGLITLLPNLVLAQPTPSATSVEELIQQRSALQKKFGEVNAKPEAIGEALQIVELINDIERKFIDRYEADTSKQALAACTGHWITGVQSS